LCGRVIAIRFGIGVGIVVGVLLGILEVDDFLQDGGIEFPAAGFFASGFLGLREQATDIGESAGATGRDAVGGKGAEEIAEDVVDIDLGDEIAGGAGEFGGEVVFAWGIGLGFGGFFEAFDVTGVGQTKAVAFGESGKGAEASIGKFEMAVVEEVVGVR
jgi:hypothetical protein